MTLSRRDAVTLGLATSIAPLLGSAPTAAAPAPQVGQRPLAPTPWSHTLFATTRLPGLEWTDLSLPAMDTSDVDPKHWKGMDVEAEIHAAMMMERIATAEQKWLVMRRIQAPVAARYRLDGGHSISSQPDEESLGTLILNAAGERGNTAIVSPTALTILQAEMGGRIVRREKGEDTRGMPHVGDLEHVRILVDLYARESIPVLVGHIPLDPEKRNAALVHVPISGVELGLSPTVDDGGWQQIRVDASTLTFI